MFVDHFLFSWSFALLQMFMEITERKYFNSNSQWTRGWGGGWGTGGIGIFETGAIDLL